MKRIAHVEMVGGAAGDMLLGALVDAGADPEAIERALRTIAPEGWRLHVERVLRGGISARRCHFEIPGEDPDEEARTAGDRVVFPRTRSLAGVLATLARSGLDEPQQSRAGAVYRRLAAAEARVHGTSVEAVHFHEVGALDAILDVASVCLALDLLRIDEVTCSAFPTGRGEIRMAHGLFPNPPPATAVLLLGAPLEMRDDAAELVTPTAAAILTTLVAEPGRRLSMRLESVGYGAGRRAGGSHPNVVRVTVGTAERPGESAVDAPAEPDTISVLEANIDDMSPQHYALAIERMFAAGARDVWLTPVTMKKQRPAIVLSAIARGADEAAVAAAMLAQTTTIGVRVRTERKYTLERRIASIETPLGAARIKIAGAGAAARALPEHDDLVALARAHDLPLPEVAKIVQASADAAVRGEATL